MNDFQEKNHIDWLSSFLWNHSLWKQPANQLQNAMTAPDPGNLKNLFEKAITLFALKGELF